MKPLPLVFDPAAIVRMVDPLTVRVERVSGSQRTPIELPPSSLGGPGSGWTKETLGSLEGWLCREWCGGGQLHITVSDSGEPASVHQWRVFYSAADYPIKPPPTMPSTAIQVESPLSIAQSEAQAQVTGDAQWPPPASSFGVTRPAAPSAPPVTPVRSTFQQAPMTPYQQVPAAASGDTYEKRLLQDQLRFANEQLMKIERERIEAQHQADLERVRADNDRKFEELKRSLTPKEDARIDKLETLITGLVEKLAAKPAGPDPAIVAIQEENRRLREDAQRDRERAEQQRRDDDRAREISELRMQIAAAAAKPNGPDPMMLMLVDMVKDVARSGQSQVDNLKAFMMSPKDIIAMNKESSGAVDEVRRTLMGSFTDIFGMQRQVMENAMAMQPQGETTIEKAIDAAKGMAERYMGAKRDETVSVAKAQAESSRAQGEMAHAQRVHMEMMAQREAETRAILDAEARANAGFNGPGAVHDGTNGVAGQPELPPQAQPVIEVVDATEMPVPPSAMRYGKTDSQWFGESLPHVEQLRAGVALYFKSIHATPPDLDQNGKPIGISADQAAKNILQAVATIVTNKLHIPAFNDLFLAQRYTEFMEVLIPNSPSQYRADAMGAIITEMNGVDDASDEDDEDDEDEDDAET